MISWSDTGAVLFDLDGTLIDSMELHAKAWQTALLEVGVGFDISRYYEMEGTNLKELCIHHLGSDASTEILTNLALRKDSIVSEMVHDSGFPIFPGVESLLDFLKQKSFPLGIVTAGSRSRVISTLPCRILKYFDVIICGDDGLKSKPDPEPYTVAFESLGAGEKGVAFENAPLGVMSAKTAGLFVIGVGSTCSRSSLENAGADLYTPSIFEFVNFYI